MDRTLARALMVEFVRLQLIINEDLTKSLLALHADLEMSSAALVSNIARMMDFLPDDSRLPQLRASLRKFQQTTTLKVDLLLVELEVAREDMEAFMKSHLQELSSQNDSQNLIGELSQKLADHSSQIRELVQTPELAEGEVSQRVLVGLMAHQPLEADFFPGI